MKKMNSKVTSALGTTTFLMVAAQSASAPFADIFEALAEPVKGVTRQNILELLPTSKEDSPFVGENELGGRGWDAEFSSWYNDDEEKWNTGFVASIQTELGLAWTAPLWVEYLKGYETEYTMINFEPTFDLDLAALIKLEFHLYFINFNFEIAIVPYRFRPFSFTFQLDPQNNRRYCFSFDYMTKGLLLEVNYEQDVWECNFGAFGVLVDDYYDCRWMNYNPELPIFEIQATKFADVSGSYLTYRCVNWYSAEWDNIYPLPGYVIEDKKE